jgi:hypothetical protein
LEAVTLEQQVYVDGLEELPGLLRKAFSESPNAPSNAWIRPRLKALNRQSENGHCVSTLEIKVEGERARFREKYSRDNWYLQ